MEHRLPEPTDAPGGTRQRFLDYLDYFRSVVAAKVADLPDDETRRSRVPSGWSALGLLKHLAYMERRWLVWGFAGRDVADPWGDRGPGDRWQVEPHETAAELTAALRDGGRRTREIVEAAQLPDRAATGGRFAGTDPPTLEWILFHVLQEYARHAGHLDIVRELTDGAVGE